MIKNNTGYAHTKKNPSDKTFTREVSQQVPRGTTQPMKASLDEWMMMPTDDTPSLYIPNTKINQPGSLISSTNQNSPLNAPLILTFPRLV